jgi:hypothetical protein
VIVWDPISEEEPGAKYSTKSGWTSPVGSPWEENPLITAVSTPPRYSCWCSGQSAAGGSRRTRSPHCFPMLTGRWTGYARPYPTACSPQAWAATAPILLVTSLMRYDTHVSRGGFWLDPVLPESYGDVHITNAPLAGGRITIDIANSVPSVQGLPDGVAFRRGHRPWFAELVEGANWRRTT